MKLAIAPVAAPDLTPDQRAQIEAWEPAELTVRVWWSFAKGLRFCASVMDPRPGHGLLAETSRQATPFDAALACYRYLNREAVA